jgi:hypothetical protein
MVKCQDMNGFIFPKILASVPVISTHGKKNLYLSYPRMAKNSNGHTFQLDLALLSCVYNFNCPAAQTILQADGGARMFYVPDTKWLIVLPINHILGGCHS